MALNREQKRALRRAGQLDEEGQPARERPKRPAAPPPRPNEERTGARQFLREVRQELRKVAWPTRPETINYSGIVLVALVVLTLLIFAFDWGVSKIVLDLFKV
jgi:preprotein translocase subunit SecE